MKNVNAFKDIDLKLSDCEVRAVPSVEKGKFVCKGFVVCKVVVRKVLV